LGKKQAFDAQNSVRFRLVFALRKSDFLCFQQLLGFVSTILCFSLRAGEGSRFTPRRKVRQGRKEKTVTLALRLIVVLLPRLRLSDSHRHSRTTGKGANV